MFEVIYKYLLIVFLILLLFLLSYTAYLFSFNQIDNNTIIMHKFAGIFLVLIAFLHTIIKRKKLKKLTKEFLNVLLNKKVSLNSHMDVLYNSLENKTIEEISIIFNITLEQLNEIFEENKILCNSKKQTLKELSKINSYKLFSIVVKIIDYKSKNNTFV